MNQDKLVFSACGRLITYIKEFGVQSGMRYQRYFLAPALLLLSACGGGGSNSGSEAPALNPPSAISAVPDSTFGSFTLTWTEPTPSVDGYKLEAKISNGAFENVGIPNILYGVNTIRVVTSADLAELTPMAFRMRSVRGSDFSTYSNVATTKLPIKPASHVSTYYDSSPGSMLVTWGNSSTLATTVKLEKAIVTSSQPGPYTTVFEGPASVHQALDSDLREDTIYRYRVSFGGQGETSAFNSTDSSPISLLPPKIISAGSVVNGVAIQWQGVSTKATELLIQRGTGFYYPSYVTIASVPPASTQYVDSEILGGFYAYRLVVKNGTQVAYSAQANLVPSPSGTGLNLATRVLTLPRDIRAMRTWSDAPASVAEGSAYYSYVIQPSPNASWPLHTIYNVGAFHDSGFSLDVIGQPHFLFRRNLGGSTNQQAVIHEWFNGTSWISDEIFRGSFYDSSTSGIRFALTADGFVHAVWQPSDSTASVWYGTNRSGTWEAVKIEPSGGIGNLGSYRIAVNPDGTAFVLLGLWDKAVLFTRPSGITTFTEEEVPTGNIDAGWYDALELRPFGTRIAIFFEFFENSSGSFKYPQMCLIKDQGSWNQPTQLVALPSSGNYTIAAASPNGRLVYGVNTPDGPRVFTLDSNQTWNSILLTPSSGYNQIQLGFNNQNKFWCAINGGWGPQPGTDIYAWYSE